MIEDMKKYSNLTVLILTKDRIFFVVLDESDYDVINADE
jgi:hypothetical protein